MSHVESLLPNTLIALKPGGTIRSNREVLKITEEVLETTETGDVAVAARDKLIYVVGRFDPAAMPASHVPQNTTPRYIDAAAKLDEAPIGSLVPHLFCRPSNRQGTRNAMLPAGSGTGR